MEPKVNFVAVGLFVVLLGSILVGITIGLGKSYDRDIYDPYHAYMEESVAGLSEDAVVKYRGVEVGRVKEIVLNPNNPEQVRLMLEIVSGTPIKNNTVAILDIQGLTGLAIVDLTGGSRDAPPLVAKPGEDYPVIQTGPSVILRFDRAITHLLNNLSRVSENIDALLEEDNRVTLQQLLKDISALMRNLVNQNQQFNQGISDATQTLANLVKMTQTLNDHVPALMARMSQSAQALEGMSQNVTQTSTALAEVINESKPGIDQFSRETLTETKLLMTELRQLTATLQQVARQLEQEPNTLVFGRPLQPRGPGE